MFPDRRLFTLWQIEGIYQAVEDWLGQHA